MCSTLGQEPELVQESIIDLITEKKVEKPVSREDLLDFMISEIHQNALSTVQDCQKSISQSSSSTVTTSSSSTSRSACKSSTSYTTQQQQQHQEYSNGDSISTDDKLFQAITTTSCEDCSHQQQQQQHTHSSSSSSRRTISEVTSSRSTASVTTTNQSSETTHLITCNSGFVSGSFSSSTYSTCSSSNEVLCTAETSSAASRHVSSMATLLEGTPVMAVSSRPAFNASLLLMDTQPPVQPGSDTDLLLHHTQHTRQEHSSSSTNSTRLCEEVVVLTGETDVPTTDHPTDTKGSVAMDEDDVALTSASTTTLQETNSSTRVTSEHCVVRKSVTSSTQSFQQQQQQQQESCVVKKILNLPPNSEENWEQMILEMGLAKTQHGEVLVVEKDESRSHQSTIFTSISSTSTSSSCEQRKHTIVSNDSREGLTEMSETVELASETQLGVDQATVLENVENFQQLEQGVQMKNSSFPAEEKNEEADSGQLPVNCDEYMHSMSNSSQVHADDAGHSSPSEKRSEIDDIDKHTLTVEGNNVNYSQSTVFTNEQNNSSKLKEEMNISESEKHLIEKDSSSNCKSHLSSYLNASSATEMQTSSKIISTQSKTYEKREIVTATTVADGNVSRLAAIKSRLPATTSTTSNDNASPAATVTTDSLSTNSARKQAARVPYAGLESAKTKFIAEANKQPATGQRQRGITPPPRGSAPNSGVVENEPKPRDPDVVRYDDATPGSDALQLVQPNQTKTMLARFQRMQSGETNGLDSENMPATDNSPNTKPKPVNTMQLRSAYLQNANESTERGTSLIAKKVDPLTEIKQMCQQQPVSVYENTPKSRDESIVSYFQSDTQNNSFTGQAQSNSSNLPDQQQQQKLQISSHQIRERFEKNITAESTSDTSETLEKKDIPVPISVSARTLRSTYEQQFIEVDTGNGHRIDPLTEIRQMANLQPVSIYENTPKCLEDGVISYYSSQSNNSQLTESQISSKQEIRQRFANPEAFNHGQNSVCDKSTSRAPDLAEAAQNIAEAKNRIRELEKFNRNPSSTLGVPTKLDATRLPEHEETLLKIAEAKKRIREIEELAKNPDKQLPITKHFNIWEEIKPENSGVFENQPSARGHDVVGAFDDRDQQMIALVREQLLTEYNRATNTSASDSTLLGGCAANGASTASSIALASE